MNEPYAGRHAEKNRCAAAAADAGCRFAENGAGEDGLQPAAARCAAGGRFAADAGAAAGEGRTRDDNI